jgi:hypothetical protein
MDSNQQPEQPLDSGLMCLVTASILLGIGVY